MEIFQVPMAGAWGRGTEERYNKFVEVLAPLNMCVYAIFEYKQVIQLLPCHVSDIMQTALLITLTTGWTGDSKHYKSATMPQHFNTRLWIFGDFRNKKFQVTFYSITLVSTDRSQQKQRGQTTNWACFKKLICFLGVIFADIL